MRKKSKRKKNVKTLPVLPLSFDCDNRCWACVISCPKAAADTFEKIKQLSRNNREDKENACITK